MAFIISALHLVLFIIPSLVLVKCDLRYTSTMAGIIVSDNIHVPYSYMKSGPAIDMALEHVSSVYNETIEFKFVFVDGGKKCYADMAGYAAADVYYKENVSVFIGPGCSLALEPLSYMAARWNLPIITPVGTSGLLADKQKFPTLSRLSFGIQEFVSFYTQLLAIYKWNHIGLIYDIDLNNSFSNIMGSTFYKIFRTTSLNLVYFQFQSSTLTSEECQLILKKANQQARVFLIFAFTKTVHQFLLAAHELNYGQGEHVFLITTPVYLKLEFWKRNNTDDQKAKEIYQSAMFIALAESFDVSYNNFKDELKSRSLRDYGYDYKQEEPNVLLPKFYDAVIIYAQLLNETLSEGGNPLDGLALTNKMKNRTFEGITGKVSINANGDRFTDLVILDMVDPVSGEFKITGYFDGKLQQYTPSKEQSTHWPNNRGPPPDIPPCGFNLDSCQTEGDQTLIISLGSTFACVILISSIIVGVCYRRWRNSAERDLWWWKISRNDLELTKNTVSLSTLSFLSRRSSFQSDTAKSSTEVHVNAAVYKGTIVQLKKLDILELSTITKSNLKEFKEIRDISQANIAKVLGACLESDFKYLVLEQCSKGTLQDVLGNTEINLDAHFRFSLAIDVAQGMTFIHQSTIHHHGNLSSMVCLIDNRFSVKITDVGLRFLYSQIVKDNTTQEYVNECLWKAPEHLRSGDNIGSKEGDVYSFGIILQEILSRDSPFCLETADFAPKDVLKKLKVNDGEPFRPKVDIPPKLKDMYQLMKRCWSEDPDDRPEFTNILKELKQMTTKFGDSGNLLDNLLRRMELYANNLEKLVDEKTIELKEEKKRSEELLYQILPRSIAEKLKLGLKIDPEAYECVTIYFSDICGFTTISARSKPMEVVDLLNDLYSCFDAILEAYDVYKVETIGDAYMVASGLPQRNGDRHAAEIAKTSLALLKAIDSFRMRHLPDEKLRLRIGLHSGPVCAGVVGVKMPRYCLFGDTVNTASRMESHGEGLKIHMSDSTTTILNRYNTFDIVERGEIEVKGKGMMTTYWLQGEHETKTDQ